jgi:hypothetical protein
VEHYSYCSLFGFADLLQNAFRQDRKHLKLMAIKSDILAMNSGLNNLQFEGITDSFPEMWIKNSLNN